MSTQAGNLLSSAILRTRAGESAGFEDLYLLSYQKTYRDIAALGFSGEACWEILSALYEEVWNKRESIPESGIFRSWLRVLLRECVKQYGGELPAVVEFSADNSTDKELTERATTVLISLEERIGMLGTGKKKAKKSRLKTRMQWLLTLGSIGATFAAVSLLFGYLNRESGAIHRAKAAVSSAVETTEHASAESGGALAYAGWNESARGRSYLTANGQWMESCWFEDEDTLYYFNEEGYVLTGDHNMERETFHFGKNGALENITCALNRETGKTVLSEKMKEEGRAEAASGIIANSLTIDGEWIYYLYMEDEHASLPSLLRVRRDSSNTQVIADKVSGYTVQQKAVWYARENKIERFEKDAAGAAIGAGFYVEQEEKHYILRDRFGKRVTEELQSINGRRYTLSDAVIENVISESTAIGEQRFYAANLGVSPSILTGEGKEYLRHGVAIDALTVFDSSLYYSVMLSTEGSAPTSQIWKLNVKTGKAEAVSGLFPGRVVRMLPYPETDTIYMEYRPGSLGSVYGKLAMVRGDETYLLDDSAFRSGEFGTGNDRLLPIWAMDDRVLAYWENCEPSSGINGEVKVLDRQAVQVPLKKKKRLGEWKKSEKPLLSTGKGGIPETTPEETPEAVESPAERFRQVESLPRAEKFIGEETTDWTEPLDGSRDFGILEGPTEE